MKAAVRYCSDTGKTALVAEAIARGVGTKAVATNSEHFTVDEKVDILFVGAALHKNDIKTSMKSFIYHMSLDNVSSAVIFSTSCFTRRAISVLRKHLYRKGVVVEKSYNVWHFPFCKPSKAALKRAERFARKYMENKEKEQREIFI